MPLDHFTIHVPLSSYEAVITFLTTSLAHLSFKEFYRPIPTVAGLGDTRPYCWISGVPEEEADAKTMEKLLNRYTHTAFTAENAKQVDEFYEKAIKAGGVCNGKPGMRPQYHPNYYGAFVREPSTGINFEVVCHTHKE